jgi:hypothetical protein
MRTLLAVVLLLCAAAGPIHAQNRWTISNVDAEARRLGARPQADWRAVMKLAPGAEIVVSRRGGPAQTRRFLAADDAGLVLLDERQPNLSASARRALLAMAREHIDYNRLFRGELFFVLEGVRVAADGVYEGNSRVAEITEVVERSLRGDILRVALPPERRGSWLGALIGGVGGGVLGVGVALGIGMENQCGSSCADEEALMGLSAVGLPLAGGWLGYHAITRTTQRVVYEVASGSR